MARDVSFWARQAAASLRVLANADVAFGDVVVRGIFDRGGSVQPTAAPLVQAVVTGPVLTIVHGAFDDAEDVFTEDVTIYVTPDGESTRPYVVREILPQDDGALDQLLIVETTV